MIMSLLKVGSRALNPASYLRGTASLVTGTAKMGYGATKATAKGVMSLGQAGYGALKESGIAGKLTNRLGAMGGQSLSRLKKSQLAQSVMEKNYRAIPGAAYETGMGAAKQAGKTFRGTAAPWLERHAYKAAEGRGLIGRTGRAVMWLGGTRTGLAVTGLSGVMYGAYTGAMQTIEQSTAGYESVGFGTYGAQSFPAMNMHTSGAMNTKASHSGLVQALHNGQ